MNFLELVNDVLVRLREPEVATISASEYATLIGKFVNDAKRQTEDAWKWDALRTELSGSTISGTSLYTITGLGLRFKVESIIDTTNDCELINQPIAWIRKMLQIADPGTGTPAYYAFNGNDGTDSKIEIYPTPAGAYDLVVTAYCGQANLVDDTDELWIPSEPVILGAYAKAIVERGEDGGMASSEAYGLFKGSLSDHIAIEATRYLENSEWVVV